MGVRKWFYSNCLVAAIKAKIEDPQRVKIHILLPWFNPRHPFVPHFWWERGKWAYEFASRKHRTLQVFWFEGKVWRRSLAAQQRLIQAWKWDFYRRFPFTYERKMIREAAKRMMEDMEGGDQDAEIESEGTSLSVC